MPMTQTQLYDLYKDDHQHITGIEDVTVHFDNGDASSAGKALRQEPTSAAIAHGYTFDVGQFDVAFELWHASFSPGLGKHEPFRPDDVIEADGVRYTIGRVVSHMWSTRWLAFCVEEA